MNAMPPPAPPLPAPEKKGLSGLAWAGIGCGTVALIVIALAIGGVILLAKKVKEFAANPEKTAAELIVASHPELQKVSSDDTKGEITVRTKNGETITANYKDIAQGKLTFRDSNGVETRIGGSSKIEDVPSWVPRVPDVTETVSVFNSVRSGKTSGICIVKSTADPQAIEDHFSAEAGKLGLGSSKRTSTTFGGTESATFSHSDSSRKLDVAITREKGSPATVTVTWQEN